MSTSEDLWMALEQLGVPRDALGMRMIRASGPGGQHVNKVSSAIQLTCQLEHCRLDSVVRERFARLAGRRLGSDGIITITAQRLRTQEQNRQDALARLLAMADEAHDVPKLRRPTRPTRASKVRRLESKQQRSQHKQRRRAVSLDD